ncbi:MAG TPA: hypothetical protein VNO21_28135 [Polyangiaceae bacterium]|nr:hypothetical protein [Polyangiaceae bacterium]
MIAPSEPSQTGHAPRDFSTVSPSAKWLLLLKAQTNLPFARQAAELLWGADAIEAARREAISASAHLSKGALFVEGRRRHFESRAQSLDQALHDLGATRVLEVAAGLSFRGLAMAAQRQDVFYLDTDLPGIAELKADLIAKLHPSPLAGTLRVQALDALDAEAFRAAIRAFPPGAITIAHEGLLMYLDEAEKVRFAAGVREALLARGGAWVTGDVYVQSDPTLLRNVVRDERTKKFLEEHRVEENKFTSFEAAETFFTAQGFTITNKLRASDDPWHIRETWILSARA